MTGEQVQRLVRAHECGRLVTQARTDLAATGRVSARLVRNIRALGGPPLAEYARVPWSRVLVCDRMSDSYVFVPAWRVWLERKLFPVHQWLLWWTKDVPERWRAYRGPAVYTGYGDTNDLGERTVWLGKICYASKPLAGDGPSRWPRIVTSLEPGRWPKWTSRRLTLLERVRLWV